MPMQPTYVYKACLARVIDGDTFVLSIDLGFHISAEKHVRLRDVNCPERSALGGPEATAFVLDLLAGRPLLVKTYKDQRSFIRWVCDVWVDADPAPLDVAQEIIKAGHGTAV